MPKITKTYSVTIERQADDTISLGRIANIDIPVYGMHSIESGTFKGLNAVINILNQHAKTK